MTAVAAPRAPVTMIPLQQPVQAGMRCAVHYTGHIWRLALVMQVFPQGRVGVRKYIEPSKHWRPKNSVLSVRELGDVTMLPGWAQDLPIPEPVLREVVA